MTDFLSKKSINEFTRSEYTDFLDAIGQDLAPTEAEADAWINHWDSVNPHPEKNGLMYWPSDGKPKTTEEIVAEIERYCRENGLPGFKDSGF